MSSRGRARASDELLDHADPNLCTGIMVDTKQLTATSRRTKVGPAAMNDDRQGVKIQGDELVATRDFEKDEPIISVKGVVKKHDEIENDPTNVYTFRIYEWESKTMSFKTDRNGEWKVKHVVDMQDANTASLARYIKAAIYKKDFNTCFAQHGHVMYLFANRNISAGEILRTTYGPETYKLIGRRTNKQSSLSDSSKSSSSRSKSSSSSVDPQERLAAAAAQNAFADAFEAAGLHEHAKRARLDAEKYRRQAQR